MSPPGDRDDDGRSLTPIEGVPLGSPLDRLAVRVDAQLRGQGERFGEELKEHSGTLHDHVRRLDRIEGEDGTNGKLSVLRGEVAAIKKWIAAIAMVALGGLGSTVMTVFSAGERNGADRIRLEQVERTLQEVRADLAQMRTEAWRRYVPSPSTSSSSRTGHDTGDSL